VMGQNIRGENIGAIMERGIQKEVKLCILL
jgi:hypothetical protein